MIPVRRAAGGGSSFSRNLSSPAACAQGVKRGPSGSAFVSSGIPDLDKILGGGFLIGSVVLISEDAEAPHHLLLLRNFIAQGLVHGQPLLFASPSKEPRAFLGTLPAPALPSQSNSGAEKEATGFSPGQDEQGLRIAWQYKKYFGDPQSQLCTERRKFFFSKLIGQDARQQYFIGVVNTTSITLSTSQIAQCFLIDISYLSCFFHV